MKALNSIVLLSGLGFIAILAVTPVTGDSYSPYNPDRKSGTNHTVRSSPVAAARPIQSTGPACQGGACQGGGCQSHQGGTCHSCPVSDCCSSSFCSECESCGWFGRGLFSGWFRRSHDCCCEGDYIETTYIPCQTCNSGTAVPSTQPTVPQQRSLPNVTPVQYHQSGSGYGVQQYPPQPRRMPVGSVPQR